MGDFANNYCRNESGEQTGATYVMDSTGGAFYGASGEALWAPLENYSGFCAEVDLLSL